MSNLPLNELLEAVQALIDEGPPPGKPPGFFTSLDFADAIGVSPPTARRKLKPLLDSGALIPVKEPVRDPWGDAATVKGYRIAPASPE